MLKKLRYKFILIAMVSLLAVLSVLVVGWNAVNYVNLCSRADRVLSVLLENGGQFPDSVFPGGKQPTDDLTDQPTDKPSGKPTGRPASGQILHGMSPETPYNSRYFSVTLDASGNALSTDMGHIAAVSEDTALEYAEEIFASGRTGGYVGVYRYGVSADGEGTTTVVFLDGSVELSAFRSSCLTSIAVSAAGALIVFLLLLIFSRLAVRPFAENCEKQKRFITDAGHELKTPLTVIGANVEVIEMENGESEWTDSIRNQVERLTELTRNLILLAGMEEERARLPFTDFSLSGAVTDTVRSFDTLAAAKGKTIDLAVRDDVRLHGNETTIRQLVRQLLDNAVKYSDENGSISVCLSRVGKKPN